MIDKEPDFLENTFAVTTFNDELWDLAGLSAVPAYDFIDIAITGDTADTDATGTCLIDIEYML